MSLIKSKIDELTNINLEDFDINVLEKMQLEIKAKKESLIKELDAISALINLGYSQLDASQVIAKIINSSEDELNVEEIIRLSLKTLVSKG